LYAVAGPAESECLIFDGSSTAPGSWVRKFSSEVFWSCLVTFRNFFLGGGLGQTCLSRLVDVGALFNDNPSEWQN